MSDQPLVTGGDEGRDRPVGGHGLLPGGVLRIVQEEDRQVGEAEPVQALGDGRAHPCPGEVTGRHLAVGLGLHDEPRRDAARGADRGTDAPLALAVAVVVRGVEVAHDVTAEQRLGEGDRVGRVAAAVRVVGRAPGGGARAQARHLDARRPEPPRRRHGGPCSDPTRPNLARDNGLQEHLGRYCGSRTRTPGVDASRHRWAGSVRMGQGYGGVLQGENSRVAATGRRRRWCGVPVRERLTPLVWLGSLGYGRSSVPEHGLRPRPAPEGWSPASCRAAGSRFGPSDVRFRTISIVRSDCLLADGKAP